MKFLGIFASLHIAGFLIFLTMSLVSMQKVYDSDLFSILNCTTSGNFMGFHETNTSDPQESKVTSRTNSESDQRYNRYVDNRPVDSKYRNKYFDDLKLYKKIDDRKVIDIPEQVPEVHTFNKNLNIPSRNSDLDNEPLKVQPLENYFDSEKSNKYIKNKIFDKYLDTKKLITEPHDSNREINVKKLDKTSYNKDSDQQYENIKKQYINIQGTDQYLDMYVEDETSKKLFDDVYTDKYFNDRNFKTDLRSKNSDTSFHSMNENIDKFVTNGKIEKHYEDTRSDILRNNKDFEMNRGDQVSNTYINKEQNNTNIHHLVDKALNDKYFEGHVIEKNLERQLDNRYRDKYLNEKFFESQLFDKDIDKSFNDDLHSNKRLKDKNFNKHTVNQNINERQNENLYFDDELKELDFNVYLNDKKIRYEDTTLMPRKESNASYLITFGYVTDLEKNLSKLNFPKQFDVQDYKIPKLHLDHGLFLFGFLRSCLRFIQPHNIPPDLLKKTLDGQVNVSALLFQSIHLELALVTVITIFVVLMLIIPGTELWLCCRSNRNSYQRHQQRGGKTLCLFLLAIIMGMCIVTMLVCNEEVTGGVNKIPDTVEAAVQDLKNYHAGTTELLRKYVTHSLDVTNEAIFADLDNVEELLGKLVQGSLSSETGVDVALNMLMDVINASVEVAYKTDVILQRAERAWEFGEELSRETEELRRELERTSRDCAPEDRSLCTILDPLGLHLAVRLDRVAHDDRLFRLRAAGQDNLTELGRQAAEDYLHIPQYISRSTSVARNFIRREINTARAKVSDDVRSIEASNTDLSDQLEKAKELSNQIIPYILEYDHLRWFIGLAVTLYILLIWMLLLFALYCRCGPSENKVRGILLWFVFLSCFGSIVLWLTLMTGLTIAYHAEMTLCRPLDDPEFKTIETILETKIFLGRPLTVSLKDTFQKCNETGATYLTSQLDNTQKLEELTTHWNWPGLSRAISKFNVDLSGLRILSPNLHERLKNLLYVSGSNLTDHRIMIQEPILNKDLTALSDQLDNVARQLKDRGVARNLHTLALRMRDLLSHRIKPLMKMQNELVYQLASLELHMQPLQRQVNQSLVHLMNLQYYIDNQGKKIGQLKAKAYVDRFNAYLEQWRTFVLTDLSSELSKCRPLWDVVRGIKLLFCSHILDPLNGLWFGSLICALIMLISTPTAHSLASTYWTQPRCKGSVLLHSRQGSPDTVIMERESWRTPDPPPSVDSW